MSIFKGYFFDLDGTLIDTAAGFEQLLIDLQWIEKPLDPIAQFLCGVDTRALLDYLLGHELVNISSLHSEFIQHYNKKIESYTFFYQDALDVLKILKELGKKTAIISNKNNISCQKIASIFKLNVDYVIGSGILPNKKPHPEPLLYVAHQLNIHPFDCFYLGDMPTDLRSARYALMNGFFARYGCYLHFDKNFKYYKEIDSLTDMISALAEDKV